MTSHSKEVTIDLLKKNLKIIQRTDFFNFSLDSLLVSEFLSLTRGVKKIVDLGTGNGAIPLFLSKKTKAKIVGIELQEVSANLAERNITLNHLEEQVTIIKDDMKNWKSHFEQYSQDAVICNPPFFKVNGNEELFNDLEQLTIARHETTITLNDIVEIASGLLKDKGYFSLVHRADRAIDIIMAMKRYSIEPKKIQFCHSSKEKNAKIILIEGIKFGKEGCKILPVFITHKELPETGYSDELLNLFK